MNPLTNYHKDISTLYFLLMYSIISRRKLHDVIFKSQIRKRQSFEKPCNESNNQEKPTLSKHIPGAQSDIDANEDDEEGQGAAMLSLKSHVKLKPDELSNITSPGKLRSKQPTYEPTTVSPFTNNTLSMKLAITFKTVHNNFA